MAARMQHRSDVGHLVFCSVDATHEGARMAVAGGTPGDYLVEPGRVEFFNRARSHAGSCVDIAVFGRAAAVRRTPCGLRFDADGAQKLDRAVDDVAVTHRIAAVPEYDALARCFHQRCHSAISASVNCSAEKALMRRKKFGSRWPSGSIAGPPVEPSAVMRDSRNINMGF